MKMKRALVALSVSLLGLPALVALLLIGRPAPLLAQHTVLYVAPGGACAPFAPRCFVNIQAAVDAAAPGDEIRIAAGVYTDTHVRRRDDALSAGVVTQTVYISKTVSLRGGYSGDFKAWDPAVYPTTLDPQGRGRGLYIVGDIAPTIGGLRITGGNAAGMGGYVYAGDFDAGGGVYVHAATAALLNNHIFGNTAHTGGGVLLSQSAGRLHNNVIAENRARNAGGLGLLYSPAFASHNTIRANASDYMAGGVYLLYSNAMLSYNTIVSNTAVFLAGGIDLASSSVTSIGNLIAGNAAREAGGMVLWYSHSSLTNDVIADNSALSGGGLWIGGSRPRLLHTTLARNISEDGVGLYVGDKGAGPSSIAMTNTLLISHTIGVSVTAPGSHMTLNGVLWHNTPITIQVGSSTVTVTNQYTGNPAFASDGYHLTAGSAARDRGVPAGVRLDIDEQARFMGLPDLGADEYWPAGLPRDGYLPLLLRRR